MSQISAIEIQVPNELCLLILLEGFYEEFNTAGLTLELK